MSDLTGDSHRGAMLIGQLIAESSLDVVQFYMLAIQRTAELAVRGMLRDIHKKFQGRPLEASDYMDDGSEIRLKITIDPVEGDAVFDFTGTSQQM
jgi:5-oxoprolinase (ATP-hydrolysing)